tara:strand:- start:2786 stop:3106 length:321 start_codon:yes stop_codon:yes gene_type:complete
MDIFLDCKKCDNAEEKVIYLGDRFKDLLMTPKNDFYLKPHYTTKEVEKYLGVKKKTIDNLCSSGEISYTIPKGVRYFLREDLERYVRRNHRRDKYEYIIKHMDLYS